jgi:hypothetical protein
MREAKMGFSQYKSGSMKQFIEAMGYRGELKERMGMI